MTTKQSAAPRFLKELAWWILFAYGLLSLFGLGAGLSDTFIKDRCKYQSLLQVGNIGYVLGCELAKPRWNLTETKE